MQSLHVVGLGKEEKTRSVNNMNFRRQTDEDDDDGTVNCNPPPLRETAFSKPLLPSSSSLLPGRSRTSDSALGGARNGIGFEQRSEGARHASHDLSPASGGGDSSSPPVARYRKCLRNHAASLGGHVLDGCGEFMAASTDALKCGACGCHRSFHRREGESDDLFYPHHQHNGGTHSGGGGMSDIARNPLLLPPPSHPALQKKHIHSFQASPSALVAFGNSSGGGITTESSSEDFGLVAPAGAGSVHRPGPPSSKKRFRTKFTAEQKVRLMEFAERIGWRIQRQDDAEMERFCAEVGVSRQVFKVWMHNNKHSMRKQ